jgi:hypothetical protein
MKIKKIILLLTIICFMSGCSATYNLEFKNSRIYETTTIREDDMNNINSNSELKEDFETYSKYYITSITADSNIGNEKDFTKKSSELKYYKNRHRLTNSFYELKYKYTFDISNYNEAYLPKYSLEYFNFLNNRDNYTISTGTNIRIFDEFEYLDEITVHIKSNHVLIDTNADEVDGYNYYWYFDRDTKDKFVYLEVSKTEKIFNYENEFVYGVIAAIITVLVIIVIVIYHYQKLKQLNQM